MIYEKYNELKEMGCELKESMQREKYEEVQIQALTIVKMASEILMFEKDAAIQMKLLGVAKTVEDILKALLEKKFEDAKLYASAQLSALLEGMQDTKKQEMTNQYYRKLIEEEVVTPENFISKYQNSEDADIKEIVEYVRRNRRVDIFNYDFMKKYDSRNIQVFFDDTVGMNYIMFMEKRMYFPDGFPKDMIAGYVNSILIEQDEKSPHCYEKEGFLVQEGDIVIDAGVAEGNFALSVIDKVKKIYLIECEEGWITALKKTFEPYQDKVVFVKKFLSDTVDENNITIDELVKQEEVNYIKMDIEGAERAALLGAENTIKRSEHLTIAACSYHKRNDENWIKEFMEQYGYQTDTTQGYMFFAFDIQAWISLELRRGLVFAKK